MIWCFIPWNAWKKSSELPFQKRKQRSRSNG
jgi:hypothetical protein